MPPKNKIFSHLKSLDIVVTPPSMLAAVLGIIERDDSSARKLSNIILKDSNLTARILRAANSSFYGDRQKVSTINQAVMVLGLNTVKCLVLSMSIYNQVSAQNNCHGDEYVRLWQHSLETAIAAQNIAESIKYNVTDEAYIVGLLHDFGLLLFQRHFPAELAQVRKLTFDGMPLVMAERKIFETDHQEVGSFIASSWNLPVGLSLAISNHHPESAAAIKGLPLLSQITVLADNLSPSKFETSDKPKDAGFKLELLEACCHAVGLGIDEIRKIYSVLLKQILYHADGMDLNMGEAVQYLSRVSSDLFDLYIELANTFKEHQELSHKILKEERFEGTIESLHTALATLSHYVNNATMNISSQGQVMRLLHDKGDRDQAFARIPALTDAIKNSVKKISILLEQLAYITSKEKIDYSKTAGRSILSNAQEPS